MLDHVACVHTALLPCTCLRRERRRAPQLVCCTNWTYNQTALKLIGVVVMASFKRGAGSTMWPQHCPNFLNNWHAPAAACTRSFLHCVVLSPRATFRVPFASSCCWTGQRCAHANANHQHPDVSQS